VIQTNEFRKGMRVEYEGSLWLIAEANHVKPGKGVAFVKTKLKNLIDGRNLEINFRSGDSVGEPNVNEVKMQVLYSDGESWHFMDQASGEQVSMTIEDMPESGQFLKEGLDIAVLFYNDRPIDVTLPNFVELKITYCEPGARGDTAQGATKPATVETGAIVQVPLFVEDGEIIRVDTRTGAYGGRLGR